MLRKKLNNNIWLVFLILMVSIFATQISYAECDHNINKGIQKIIDATRMKYQIPGVQVSISCPGEEHSRDFVSGSTTMDGVTPIKPDHLFQIGSETKSFIAAIILQLEAEGWLSIYHPVGKYLQNIPDSWKKITIRQLLNHTSGIFNYTETDEFLSIEKSSDFKKQWVPEELIKLIINKKPYFEPGMGFHYSNTNYVLAGMIIRAVTGKSVEEEIKSRLLDPSHLSNTYYLPRTYNEDIMQRMAHGYFKLANSPSIDVTDYNMSMADAAGAIISTSRDTAIWLRQLLTTDSILPDRQRNEMMNLVDEDNGQPLPNTSNKIGYGLGIEHGFISDSSGGEIWTHGGGTMGYISNMIWLKCNNVVITTIINISSEDNNGNGALVNDLIAYIQKTDTSNQCNMKSGSQNLILLKQIR